MTLTLLDVLKLIKDDAFPPVMEIKNDMLNGIDTRPQSVFEITVCFMCEEETWLTCNIQNEILIPWYDCEVESIQPDDFHKNAICVWLRDEEYLRNRFWNCFETVEKEGD